MVYFEYLLVMSIYDLVYISTVHLSLEVLDYEFMKI